MNTLLMDIQKLRAKRDFYERLGKRGKVAILESQLRSMVMRQFQDEAMREQMDADFIAIAGGDFDLATQVYEER